MSDKIIFSDVDEVIFKWLPVFSEKVKIHGYKIIDNTKYDLHEYFDINHTDVFDLVDQFNRSVHFENLPPIDDSIHYIHKICEEFGYKFYFVSACGNNEVTKQIRTKALTKLIGSENIVDIVCVNSSAEKVPFLSKNRDKGYIWVEDNIKNAEMGKKLGYDSYLYENDWNLHYKGDIPHVTSWQDIYNVVAERENNILITNAYIDI